MRDRFVSPSGLFPQQWPGPDGESEAECEAHVVAALIMDDYDAQPPPDSVPANIPRPMSLPNRILQASTVFELQPDQIRQHVQHPDAEVNVQDNE
eukprot:2457981-Amphidinium_carterae.1